jgi:putative ABC transport system permease protein
MSDVRLAIRALVASPIVSIVAVVSLALGIGANTAVFSVVNGLLLRPLPVVDPERLVTVSSDFAVRQGFRAGLGIGYTMWRQFDEHAGSFDGGFAWAPAVLDLSPGGEIQPANALIASGGFFQTLGVRALIGRTFTPADDVSGGGVDGPVAVISYGFWQRRFGGAPDVLGSRLPVNGVPVTIVGVTPQTFFGIEVGQPFDLVLPLAIDPLIRGAASLHNPASLMLTVMLRLKPDQSLDSAAATLRTIQSHVLEAGGLQAGRIPKFLKEPFTPVPAATGTSDRSGLRRQYQQPLIIIFAVVSLVLLIACANIANLLLARAAARRHELSVRLALGATRWRLARQLLVESLVLSVAGAALGVIFARWAAHGLVAGLSTPDSRIALDLTLDWRVMVFTAAVSIATAVLFGARPALVVTAAAPIDALKDQGRGTGRRANLSNGLVVIQVALSLTLLVGATLLVGTFDRLANVPLGFDADRVLIVNVDTSRAHSDSATRDAYYQRLVDAVGAVPGVQRAAGSRITPLSGGAKSPLNAEPGRVIQHVVTPDWFAVYGTTLRAGRDFNENDTAGAPRVAIVNDAYVRRFIQSGTPLGAAVSAGLCGDAEGHCTIVGVVADAVFASIRTARQAAIYLPMTQSAGFGPPGRTRISISIRAASGSPALLSASIAEALTSVNRNLTFSFRPLAEDVAATLVQERLVAALSAFFGGLAVLLAALGLYGVTSYAVTCQRMEIGIRLALGASPRKVMGEVLSRVAKLIVIGLIVGTAVSMWASKFIATVLYGLEPRDPVSFVNSAVILALVGALAGWLPALRAAAVDPARTLRTA